MNHLSLFSGIGGFDIAAEWMGWNNIAHCEWNPFGQSVLNYYWPNAISYDDITKTDFTIHRGDIDIVTGGFPCQPYSVAGKRKGKDDERHLWPEMLRAIREIQPRWVVGENVRGIINWNAGMVFNEVQADLEAEGYEILPFLLPAAGVNAPHERYRTWFVAWNSNNSNVESIGEVLTRQDTQPRGVCQPNVTRSAADSESIRGRERHGEGVDDCGRTNSEHFTKGCEVRDRHQAISGTGVSANSMCGRQSGEEYRQEKSGRFTEKSLPDDWQNFPTQSPVCNGDDGLSARLDGITFSKWRNESIKAGGNAIVPQEAYQIFQAIQQYEFNVKTIKEPT